MRFSSRLLLLAIVSLANGLTTAPQNLAFCQEARSVAMSPSSAALAYLKSLSAEQLKLAQIPFNDIRRQEWHFIPMETRKGLPIREMNDAQNKLALELLRSVTSEAGFKRATDTMSYESILLQLEGPASEKRRDYRKYYVAIYGEPNNQSQWGLSIEGHHMSLNFTFDRGVVVDSTPQLFASNPASLKKDFEVPSAAIPGRTNKYQKGHRLLASEEDTAFLMLNSLNDAQKSKAVFNTTCPEDIQWAGEPQPKPSDAVGIPAAELTGEQKKLLMNLVDTFQANVTKEVALSRMNVVSNAGVDKIHFGWAGATSPDGQYFFRIQGPTFIGELCNFQKDPEGNSANHIHCVWRDLTGDFNLPVTPK